MGRGVLILGWHNVTSTPYFASSGSVATDGFTSQMRLLKLTTTPISLTEAVVRLADGRALPPRATVVTFDDGYRDNLQVAAPILAELHIPATFFLVPKYLSSREPPWWERLAWAVRARRRTGPAVWRDVPVAASGADPDATLDLLTEHLKSLDEDSRQRSVQELIELFEPAGDEPASPMMDWEEARQLARMGFAIGSHSCRHSILSNEPAAIQLEDLREARTLLAEGIGTCVDLLAYPNGGPADFGPGTVESARRAGYRAAVTTIDGWNDRETDPFALRRFLMYPEWGPAGFGVLARHVARIARRRIGSGLSDGGRPEQTRRASADQSSSAPG